MEIEKAAGYSDIRLTKISSHWSDSPLDEPEGFDSLWAKPADAASTFSAVCMFFAEQIQDELAGIPIGLIDATWGGTIVEAWSPPEALEACDVADAGTNDEQNHNTYLWNGMIQPLTQMSIRGALWYQGEANTGHNKEIYDCTFENMISSWRQRWNENTEGLTDELFPFGFVQLAPNRDNRNNFNWPIVRWKQTGEMGYVPNERLEYVFMAAAMDDDIDLHPKNKRLPSSRLALAALNLVYGAKYDNEGTSRPPLNGPQPLEMTNDEAGSMITVKFSQELEEAPQEQDRFMVCCLAEMDECDQAVYGEGWVGVPITGMGEDNLSVTLDTSNTGCAALSAWLTSGWRLPVLGRRAALSTLRTNTGCPWPPSENHSECSVLFNNRCLSGLNNNNIHQPVKVLSLSLSLLLNTLLFWVKILSIKRA